jgi:Alpha-L-fucosidase
MKRFYLPIFIFSFLCSCSVPEPQEKSTTFNQNTDTITENELQQWKNDHFGMFIHFGVYSKLAGIWNGKQIPYYGEQIMNHARIPIPEYEAVAKDFNPIEWDAKEVVKLAKESGMKYIVFTTKHHDGFCMFKTATTDYNIVDFTPFKRDIVKELADACQKYDMKLGFYYSLPDWHFPQGVVRMAPDSTTDCTEFVNQVYSPLESITPELEEYIVAQLTELLTNYGDIETIWFDMGLVKPEQSKRFRDVVKTLQPRCLISGRIMNNEGDYLTLPDNGKVVGYADVYWDNPASLYGTWGYKSWIDRPETDLQAERQINRLLSTVSHGGVFLLNIGPDNNGKVIDYEKEVLSKIGAFLSAHPDTLKHMDQKPELTLVDGSKTFINLTDDNGLTHAAFDASTYITTQSDSWRSWNISIPEDAKYDVFVEYLPEFDGKEYIFKCNGQELKHILPGVDKMLQTAYIGEMTLKEGENEFVLDQDRCNALDPLGIQLKQIILRKI